MSGGLVKTLMDPGQTLAALRAAPLSTGDFLKNRLAPKERRDVGNNLLLAYEHVPPADRICFFDISVTPGTNGELHQLHIEPQVQSATLQSGKIFKTAKRLKPIFYLPYRKNGTTRMKLAQPPGWGGGEVKTGRRSRCRSTPRPPAVRSAWARGPPWWWSGPTTWWKTRCWCRWPSSSLRPGRTSPWRRSRPIRPLALWWA